MKSVIKLTRLAGSLSVYLVLASCSPIEFECDQSVQAVVPSPNGGFIAKVLLVQCGATTADVTWVLLARSGGGFNGDKDKVAIFEGGAVDVYWRGEIMNVEFAESRIFKMEREVHGVEVIYSQR